MAITANTTDAAGFVASSAYTFAPNFVDLFIDDVSGAIVVPYNPASGSNGVYTRASDNQTLLAVLTLAGQRTGTNVYFQTSSGGSNVVAIWVSPTDPEDAIIPGTETTTP